MYGTAETDNFSEKVEFVRGVHVTLGWVGIERRVESQPLQFEPRLGPRVQREGHSGSVAGEWWNWHLVGEKHRPVLTNRKQALVLTQLEKWSLLMRLMYRTTKTTLQLKAPCCASVYSNADSHMQVNNPTAAGLTGMWWICFNRVLDSPEMWKAITPVLFLAVLSRKFAVVSPVWCHKGALMRCDQTSSCACLFTQSCVLVHYYYFFLFHSLPNTWYVPRSICFSRRQLTEG